MSQAGKKAGAGRLKLERMALVRGVLMGFRSVLDEELQPVGITAAQLRVLYAVGANPAVSGAEVARLCALKAQSAQAILAGLETHGWICRRPGQTGGRVLVSELTAAGRKALRRAKGIAEALDRRLWKDIDQRDLAVLDAALAMAVKRLARE